MVEQSGKISLLINAIFFFLECAFIEEVADAGGYRLVVNHKGRVLTDRCYDSTRGARIAFSRMYHTQGLTEGVRAEWSHFYPPEGKWLKKRVEA
jgi:hypothetical protein